MKQFKHKKEWPESQRPVFFKVNGTARDTDNNKLHNEKTPQLTKGQRYDRFKQKSTFQTSWKEKIPLVEVSGRLITTVI